MIGQFGAEKALVARGLAERAEERQHTQPKPGGTSPMRSTGYLGSLNPGAPLSVSHNELGGRVAFTSHAWPLSPGLMLDSTHAPGLDCTPATHGYPLESAHTLQIVLSNSLRIACVSRVQVA